MTDSADQVPAPADGRTFYKRLLPCPPAVSFSSPEGKSLFAGALQAGTMQGFFKLIEQFRTQDEPAYCGLASLAMVLNALAIDPKRAWKGPWRWFHEQMLDCCQPLSQVLQTGIVLDQAACLARCNGAKAGLWRYSDFSEDSFRSTVRGVCTSDQQHLIVSYSRQEFLQTGDGHFSPVGGYHAGQDMVLILDTARFKYPPHWVPLRRLYQAMARVDSATGQPRGYLNISANTQLQSVMFTLNPPNRAWQDTKTFMDTKLPSLLQQPALTSSQPQSAYSAEALTHTANALKKTPKPLENLEHVAAAKALLPVVMAMPKDSVLQLLAVRSGSAASCCISAAAACISSAATNNPTEAASQAAGSSPAAIEAAFINPAAVEAVIEAAPTSKGATKAVSVIPVVAEAACTSAAAVEAACISPAATDLFLSELHSTDLFQVVRHCLDQAQQQLAAGQPLSRQQSQDATMQKTPTGGQALRQGQTERDKASLSDVSCEAIPNFNDRGVHPAVASAGGPAVASLEAPSSSTVRWDADVTEGLCQSDVEVADDNHERRISQQELGGAQTKSCQVRYQTDAAVQASCCSQVAPPEQGSSLGQNPDCSPHCMVAAPAEQTDTHTNCLSADDTSPPLAEMICMLLLLVPRTAWHHACDEVQANILQILDMSPHSIVASEADYLAAQWAELPQLQSQETESTLC